MLSYLIDVYPLFVVPEATAQYVKEDEQSLGHKQPSLMRSIYIRPFSPPTLPPAAPVTPSQAAFLMHFRAVCFVLPLSEDQHVTAAGK